MRKYLFALLVYFVLFGLSGCKTSRATVKTEKEASIQKTEVSDSSSVTVTETSDILNAILTQEERKDAVIEFEEWEYYPVGANDTLSAGNYTQISGISMHKGSNEGKPPDTGALKKHRKGTLTLSSVTNTSKTQQQESVTSSKNEKENHVEGTTNATVKEKDIKKETGKRSVFVWIVLGLLCAVVSVGLGIYLAKRRK